MGELSLYMHRSLVDMHQAFPNSTLISVDNLLTLGMVVDCLIQISGARSHSAVRGAKAAKGQRRAASRQSQEVREAASARLRQRGGGERPSSSEGAVLLTVLTDAADFSSSRTGDASAAAARPPSLFNIGRLGLQLSTVLGRLSGGGGRSELEAETSSSDVVVSREQDSQPRRVSRGSQEQRRPSDAGTAVGAVSCSGQKQQQQPVAPSSLLPMAASHLGMPQQVGWCQTAF